MDNYGIEKTWRKKVSITNKIFDSLKYVYKIKLPRDLTVAEIVKAENFAFVNSHSVFNSNELKDFGKTKIEISSSKHLKFEAYLSADTNLYRRKSKILLLVKINDITDAVAIGNVLNSSFPLSLLAVPSNMLERMKQQIKERNKGYSILLSDDIDDTKYKLDTDFNRAKLLRNIRAITTDFSDALSFVIKDNSALSKSMLYNFIISKFKQSNIKVIKMSHYILLTSEDKADILSRFNFYSSGTDTSKINKMILSLANFNMLLPEVKNSIKAGTKFVLK